MKTFLGWLVKSGVENYPVNYTYQMNLGNQRLLTVWMQSEGSGSDTTEKRTAGGGLLPRLLETVWKLWPLVLTVFITTSYWFILIRKSATEPHLLPWSDYLSLTLEVSRFVGGMIWSKEKRGLPSIWMHFSFSNTEIKSQGTRHRERQECVCVQRGGRSNGGSRNFPSNDPPYLSFSPSVALCVGTTPHPLSV